MTRLEALSSPGSDAQYEPLNPELNLSGKDVMPDPTRARKSSLFACLVTLTNTLLGVSIIGTAHGFASAGYGLGGCLFVVFAFFSAVGLHLLAVSARTVGKTPSSFYTVAKEAAPRFTLLIDIAVAVKCFGVATSYLTVVGDVMPDAMEAMLGRDHEDSVLLRRSFWVTAGFAIVAPLAFARTLGALKYTATLAICFVVFLVGMVAAYAIVPSLDACPDEAASFAALQTAPADLAAVRSGSSSGSGAVMGGTVGGSECFEEGPAISGPLSVLPVLSIFVFGFTCHQNIFTICDELRDPTPRRVDAVIAGAISTALLAYLTISVAAYASFGIAGGSDVLASFPESPLLTAARVCVALLVCCCYPLQAHPSRKCMLSAWDACGKGQTRKSWCGRVISGRVYSSPTEQDSDDEGGSGSEAPALIKGRKVHAVHNDGVVRGGEVADEAAESIHKRGATESLHKCGVAEPAAAGAGAAEGVAFSAAAAAVSRWHECDGDGGSVGALLEDGGKAAGAAAGGGERGAVADGNGGSGSHGGGRGAGNSESDGAGFVDAAALSRYDSLRHYTATSLFLCSSYAIAMSVTDLGVLLEVVGATGSTIISYVLPGFIYAALHPRPHWRRRLAVLQLSLGCIIMPVCLASIFAGRGRGQGEAPG